MEEPEAQRLGCGAALVKRFFRTLGKALLSFPKLLIQTLMQRISLWTLTPIIAITRTEWGFWMQVLGFCIVFAIDDLICAIIQRR